MHHTIVSGSKEYVLVTVGDRLETIATLTGLVPTFTVYDKNDVPKQTDVAADISVLVAKCLVDTTLGGNWASGIYRLFLKLNATPELPILGPIEFRVEGV